jgi:alpha-tubulin suppressor-like RCC1 family protein
MNLHCSFSSLARVMIFIDEEDNLHHWRTNTIEGVVLTKPDAELCCLSCGQLDTILLDSKGRLYELTASLTFEPKNVVLPEDEKTVFVACGNTSVALLTEKGNVYTYGENGFGQLGLGSAVDKQAVPTKVDLPAPVVSLASGSHHVLAVTEEGELWAWGRNDDGKLGIGEFQNNKNMPVLTPLKNVIQAFAGSHHSMALTQEGALYSFGWNQYGNLGTGDTSDRSNPYLLFSKGVREAASGWNHAACLLEDGSVYYWGTVSGFTADKVVPTKVNFDPSLQFSYIGCNGYQCFTLDTWGNLWIWGSQDAGGIHGEVIETPERYEKQKFKVPRLWAFEWKKIFLWLFLGKSDLNSNFSFFPVEVVYQFVLTTKRM